MVEHWNCSNDKLVSAEEGLKPEIRKTVKREKVYRCEQFLQIVKLILYLQLIFFVAWGGYTFWQAYNQHENIRYYIFNVGSDSSNKAESMKVFNESPSVSSNDIEETSILTTKTNIPMERDVISNSIVPNDDQLVTTDISTFDFRTDKNDIFLINPEEKIVNNIVETTTTTTTSEPITDSSESQTDDYENRVKNEVSSLEIMENNDKENSVDQAVFNWDIPLLSALYIEPLIFIDDSSEETGNSETNEVINEYLKEIEERNEEIDFEKEQNYFHLIKLFTGLLNDLSDDYSVSSNSDNLDETIESSKMDEEQLKDCNHNVMRELYKSWSRVNSITEKSTTAFISEKDSEENTKSSLYQDRMIEEEKEEEEEEKEEEEEEEEKEKVGYPYDYLMGNQGHGYFDSTTGSFIEGVDSEKSDTSKVEDDDTSDLKSESWERWNISPMVLYRSTLDQIIQDSSTETSQTEEESTKSNISKEIDVEPFPSTTNADIEMDIKSGRPCLFSINILYGMKIFNCTYSPLQSTNEEQNLDTSTESSINSYPSTIEINDESSSQNTHISTDPHTLINYDSDEMKSSDEYVDINYGVFDPEPIKESTEVINSESEKSDISTEWWKGIKQSTNPYSIENSYQNTEDPIRWWLDMARYQDQSVFSDDKITERSIFEDNSEIDYLGEYETFSADEDSYWNRRRRRTTMNDDTLINNWIEMYKTRTIKNKMREYSMARLNEKLARFYSNMDLISSHIDALNDLYLRERKLEDDYLSKEIFH